jgi:outer membrane protein OmpA-like peptidoglycan-associated protein
MPFRRKTSEFNFWPSVADMILAAFMIFLILWFAEKVLLLNKFGELPSDKPPVITLKENSGFKFASGKAELSAEFEQLLLAKVPEIKRIFQDYSVDVIEIIGHTDGTPVTGKRSKSNLDQELENVAGQTHSIEILQFGSNADLGLIRALAVALFLKQQDLPKNIKFRIYSAAQLISAEDGSWATVANHEPNERRRRIELRFTRLEATSP